MSLTRECCGHSLARVLQPLLRLLHVAFGDELAVPALRLGQRLVILGLRDCAVADLAYVANHTAHTQGAVQRMP